MVKLKQDKYSHHLVCQLERAQLSLIYLRLLWSVTMMNFHPSNLSSHLMSISRMAMVLCS